MRKGGTRLPMILPPLASWQCVPRAGQGGTRTPTVLLPPAPQAGRSALRTRTDAYRADVGQERAQANACDDYIPTHSHTSIGEGRAEVLRKYSPGSVEPAPRRAAPGPALGGFMKYQHRVLGMLSLLSVITYLDRVCIAVAGPRMQDDLHISPEAWGWVTSVFFLSYSAFETSGNRFCSRLAAPRHAVGDGVAPPGAVANRGHRRLLRVHVGILPGVVANISGEGSRILRGRTRNCRRSPTLSERPPTGWVASRAIG